MPTTFDPSEGWRGDQVETHYKPRPFQPDCLGNGLTPGAPCECELDVPTWACATVKPGEEPVIVKVATGDLTATPGATTAARAATALTIRGANPLYGRAAVVPFIDLNVDVAVERTADCEARITLEGAHDGFPWYEIWVSSGAEAAPQLAHSYSAADKRPFSLVGDGDQAVSSAVTIATC